MNNDRDRPDDSPAPARFDPASISRPDPALLQYYILCSLLTIVGFPFFMLALYFKYRTLRYRFDEKGVSMSWGLLFRREVYLTYRRIQDIHVTRNLFHRWLGLAELSLQTASGATGSEMKVEGITRPELLRDYLYARMRGARDEAAGDAAAGANESTTSAAAPDDEALALLREIRDELRSLRAARGAVR